MGNKLILFSTLRLYLSLSLSLFTVNVIAAALSAVRQSSCHSVDEDEVLRENWNWQESMSLRDTQLSTQ